MSSPATRPEESADREDIISARSTGPAWPRWELWVVIALAAVLRLTMIERPPYVDEFNHILAGLSLLSGGGLAMAEGAEPYTRAWLFTYLVAGSFYLFGESFFAARIPAFLAGTGLVLLAFLWVRSVAGRGAAWITALLLSVDLWMIGASQLSRFYSLQGLLFLAGAILVFRAENQGVRPRRQVELFAGAIVLLGLAVHLQITTIVGIAALALWVTMRRAVRYTNRAHFAPRRPILIAAVVVVLAGGAVGVAWVSGQLTSLWNLFQYADIWAAGDVGNIRYYHWALLEQYPTLWTLFPVAVLLAATRNPRVTIFCTLIFTVALVVHSLAAWKHPRYMLYSMPFLFVVCSIAAAAGFVHLRAVIGSLVNRIRPAPMGPASVIASLVAVICLIYALAGNPGFGMGIRDALGMNERPWMHSQTRWDDAAPLLSPLVTDASVVISSHEFAPLYYLGRADVGLSATRLGSREEFAVFPKLSRPEISSPESLQRLVNCYQDGIVIVESHQWGHPALVPPDAAEFIGTNLEEVHLPQRLGVRAFRWLDGGDGHAESCQEIWQTVRRADLG